mgnify:CR=1 FL=1
MSEGATVAADGYEDNLEKFQPSKVVDGDDTTRWASPAKLGQHWISLDYGKEISIQSFKIHWSARMQQNIVWKNRQTVQTGSRL